jgi:carbamoyl-phosphate synthase large subunit
MIASTLLITGCGGDIGLALGALARKEQLAGRVVGCDITSDHAGPAVFDTCEMVPSALSSDYFTALEALVRRHSVKAIVPMSEAELAQFAAQSFLERFADCHVIAANQLAVKTGLDKYSTYQMLRHAGLPTPWTCVVGEEAPRGFPCILKPRRGQGGKGLMRVRDAFEAEALTPLRRGDIWQELILPEEPEYTCGLYRTTDGDIRTIILERKLAGGATKSAILVEHDAITVLLHRIAKVLDLRGAINVQLRVDAQAPKVFEINARFSSTVGFRHRLGFQDFVWALRERHGLSAGPFVQAPTGTRVYRGIDVLVVPP